VSVAVNKIYLFCIDGNSVLIAICGCWSLMTWRCLRKR